MVKPEKNKMFPLRNSEVGEKEVGGNKRNALPLKKVKSEKGKQNGNI